jgi:prolyl-tRNA synthetase
VGGEEHLVKGRLRGEFGDQAPRHGEQDTPSSTLPTTDGYNPGHVPPAPMETVMPETAIQPTRAQDYPEWYQQVVRAAELAEQSPVRGCMVIKPHGYAIWERMQGILDGMFKATGHQNAYFPLFIPLSYLEQEAKHVEGFAKECAVVTHHRLELGPDGRLIPTGKLEEPLVVRPTSETIIGATYAKWVQSWRDLPILVNQWANVVRWEMRPRVFLRTTEFLWQEGHTAHATSAEAVEETLRMLDVYATFAERDLAMPVIKGPKPAGERFPGAVDTFSIEAMMQDGKALQAGTSHFLGQNFARAQGIKFADKSGVEEFCWTTSWGVSTRLIGAVIMTHSDDDGLVLPPRIAPQHVVLLPIHRSDEERAAVLAACEKLQAELAAVRFAGEPVRAKIDARDLRGGDKVWQHVKQGVPLRVEIGPRDLAAGTASLTRRDRGPKERTAVPLAEFAARAPAILEEIQHGLFARAQAFRAQRSVALGTSGAVLEYFGAGEGGTAKTGFARVHVADDAAVTAALDPLKVTVRCVPMEGPDEPGTCVFTGRPVARPSILARAY